MIAILLAVVPATPSWQLVLFGCNLAAYLALLGRILQARLAKSYPVLVVWLAFNIIGSAVPWIVRMDVYTYYWFYIWAEGCALVLYFLIVLELYAKVLRSLPGLATTLRVFIEIVIPTCAAVSLLLLRLETRPRHTLDWLYRMDQTVVGGLALFVLLITGFMVWFPICVPRNVVVYSIGYAGYLLPKGATLLLVNHGFGDARLAGVVFMTFSTLCVLFWALALNRRGDSAMVSLSPGSGAGDESRLVGQLTAINQALWRFAQK